MLNLIIGAGATGLAVYLLVLIFVVLPGMAGVGDLRVTKPPK
jgi:hypothetical protein